ncbi:hypothetical protein AB0F71_03000 [Kitasatospora sp. NPDC028055]|uniref:hypothetical protein n=1 Tax=Kitasatospora sp. NPDC028055 TaxID=3155653 RepID=UPI00340F0F13
MSDNSGAVRRISIMSGRHELTVHSLSRSEESFTLDYSITPPLPDDLETASPSGTPVFMWLEAVDDLGNRYDDVGGAHGLSPDGSRTSGTISGRPGLPSEAGSLTVRLMFMAGNDEFGYDLMFAPLASD